MADIVNGRPCDLLQESARWRAGQRAALVAEVGLIDVAAVERDLRQLGPGSNPLERPAQAQHAPQPLWAVADLRLDQPTQVALADGQLAGHLGDRRAGKPR